MALANENYLKTPQIFYSTDIEKRINAYKILHPQSKIINLGAADVTRPLSTEVTQALHKAVDEMSKAETFKGYSPFQGYDFLVEKIMKDYRSIGVSLDKESIFVNTGAKSDVGNIGHVLGHDNIVALADPVYPIYENATIMSGRAGELWENGKWSNIVYLTCSEETDFIPQLPEEHVDVIYMCNPCNPTGVAVDRKELKKWVDYAIENKSIIIYDGAYSEFINNPDIPRSIYEIKGAKKVAIELRTYSKMAGFTGLRCGYSIMPTELTVYTKMEEKVPFIELWKRRNVNYTNGVSYLVQRGAEAVYSRKGKKEIKELVEYYLTNARTLKKEFEKMGHKAYGAENAPYVWLKIKGERDSLQFFHHLLYDYAITATPGIMFGPLGEGFIRFTGFASREDTLEALERINEKKYKIE